MNPGFIQLFSLVISTVIFIELASTGEPNSGVCLSSTAQTQSKRDCNCSARAQLHNTDKQQQQKHYDLAAVQKSLQQI